MLKFAGAMARQGPAEKVTLMTGGPFSDGKTGHPRPRYAIMPRERVARAMGAVTGWGRTRA